MKKVCTKCKVEKDLSLYYNSKDSKDGKRSRCIDCEYIKLTKRIVFFEKIITHRICTKCGIKKELKCFHKDGSRILGTSCQCRICDNPEKKKQWNKAYRENPMNKEKILKTKNEYYKQRKKTDEVFNLRCNLKRDMSNILKERGFKKNMRTEEMLGSTVVEFREYIKSKWEAWMTWENHGLYNGEFNFGWDYDHIIPLSSATTKEELIKLFHYTNYQPLCSYINRDIKKDSII
jgi:hypothetical protein